MLFSKSNPIRRHRELVRNGARLLDVRTPDEFAAQHLPGAMNIPVDQLPARAAELGPTSGLVVVYCRSGARSARATAILRAAGYEVHDLGAMASW